MPGLNRGFAWLRKSTSSGLFQLLSPASWRRSDTRPPMQQRREARPWIRAAHSMTWRKVKAPPHLERKTEGAILRFAWKQVFIVVFLQRQTSQRFCCSRLWSLLGVHAHHGTSITYWHLEEYKNSSTHFSGPTIIFKLFAVSSFFKFSRTHLPYT